MSYAGCFTGAKAERQTIDCERVDTCWIGCGCAVCQIYNDRLVENCIAFIRDRIDKADKRASGSGRDLIGQDASGSSGVVDRDLADRTIRQRLIDRQFGSSIATAVCPYHVEWISARSRDVDLEKCAAGLDAASRANHAAATVECTKQRT